MYSQAMEVEQYDYDEWVLEQPWSTAMLTGYICTYIHKKIQVQLLTDADIDSDRQKYM